MKAGAVEFLTKPFRLRESSAIVERLNLLLHWLSGWRLPHRPCWCSEKQAPAKN
jgi:hypothetical protein